MRLNRRGELLRRTAVAVLLGAGVGGAFVWFTRPATPPPFPSEPAPGEVVPVTTTTPAVTVPIPADPADPVRKSGECVKEYLESNLDVEEFASQGPGGADVQRVLREANLACAPK